MTLHHFPHQAIDGSWHAVYRCPQTKHLNSIGAGCSETSAKAMADAANRQQDRQHAKAMAEAVAPADRPIPAGFYSDADAA